LDDEGGQRQSGEPVGMVLKRTGWRWLGSLYHSANIKSECEDMH